MEFAAIKKTHMLQITLCIAPSLSFLNRQRALSSVLPTSTWLSTMSSKHLNKFSLI